MEANQMYQEKKGHNHGDTIWEGVAQVVTYYPIQYLTDRTLK